MIHTVFFNGFHHLLQCIPGGYKNPILIRIPEHSVECGIYPASGSLIYEKTVEDATQDCPLADSVTEAEEARKETIPTNISKRKHVYKNEESQVDF